MSVVLHKARPAGLTPRCFKGNNVLARREHDLSNRHLTTGTGSQDDAKLINERIARL
jgi:hypothetical protein